MEFNCKKLQEHMSGKEIKTMHKARKEVKDKRATCLIRWLSPGRGLGAQGKKRPLLD